MPEQEPTITPRAEDATAEPNGGNTDVTTEPEVYKTKDDFQRAIARVSNDLKKNKDLRDEIRAEIEQELRTKTLEEQGQFKDLAEQRAAKIAELEAKVGDMAALTAERDEALAVVTGLVDAELKDAPDYVREAIADRSPTAQLAYINQHRDKWKTTPLGIRETPRPSGTGELTREDRKNKYLQQAGKVVV